MLEYRLCESDHETVDATDVQVLFEQPLISVLNFIY
jgi:hypothetical protein